MDIVILILGWALGLLSVVISDLYRDWRPVRVYARLRLRLGSERRERVVVCGVRYGHDRNRHRSVKRDRKLRVQVSCSTLRSVRVGEVR